MVLLDKPYLQIAIIAFVAYIVYQMSKTATEHLDTVVNVDASGTQVKVGGETIAQVPLTATAEQVTTTQSSVPTTFKSTSATTSSTNAGAISTGLSALAQTPASTSTSTPAPLTAVSEELLASAPSPLGITEEESVFNPQAVDYDEIFNRNQDLEPSELIPKTEAGDLYANLKPDPAFAGNFLTNAWQLGIETTTNRRNYISDLRKLPAVPLGAVVSPWNNPGGMGPDLNRRGLCDVE